MRKTLIQDGALALAGAPFMAVVLWLADREFRLGPVVVTLMAVQTLLIVIRRVSPVTCVVLMLVLQTAISAAAPHGTGLRGIGPAIAVYTCGTLLASRTAITL